MGGGGGVGELDVVAVFQLEVAEAEGGEHQLAGETEVVDRLWPIVRPEGAERLLVLAQQDVGLGAGAKLGVLVLGAGLLGPARRAELVLEDRQRVVALQHRPAEIGVEAVRQLHDNLSAVPPQRTVRSQHVA